MHERKLESSFRLADKRLFGVMWGVRNEKPGERQADERPDPAGLNWFSSCFSSLHLSLNLIYGVLRES